MSEEKVPNDWVRAIVVPLYKGNGDRNNCKNYRGISLLSCNAPEAFSASTAALADGYDPPKAIEESPVSSAASPTSSVLSIMQKPPLSEVHLTRIVRKIGQQERAKAPAPRTRCLGSTVARFARPFEARPVDPARQKSFSQLLEICAAATTSGWFAPTGCTATVPPPLDRGLEECSESPIPSVKKRRKKKTVK